MNGRETGTQMRVLHIISGDLWAGAEVQAYHTICLFSKRENLLVSVVLFNEGRLRTGLQGKGIPVVLIDEMKLSFFSILMEIRRLMKDLKPDVVHAHAVKEHFIGKAGSLLSGCHAKLVRTVHGLSGVPANLPWWKHFRSAAVVALDKYLIGNHADGVIAVSGDLEKHFKQRGVKGRVRRIYNGLDIEKEFAEADRSQVRERFGLDNKGFWVGTAARLVEVKNLPVLVMAGRHLAEEGIPFRISIFGEGPQWRKLENLIKQFDLEGKVVLQGFEPDMLPVIAAMDTFVLCSKHEGLPMALLEAMTVGTPVACTAVGGMKEVIENGVNGLLVESGDSKALGEALALLYHNKEMARRMAENARKVAQQRFSVAGMVDEIEDFYSEIVLGIRVRGAV